MADAQSTRFSAQLQPADPASSHYLQLSCNRWLDWPNGIGLCIKLLIVLAEGRHGELGFWINAFIPLTVPGYTRVLTAGPHKGKTAIPLPGVARFWPGNTFKDRNCGYLTDQRSFSPLLGASSRMKSWFSFDTVSMLLTEQMHTTSGTTEVNLETGVENGVGFADMSGCSYVGPGPAPASGVRPPPMPVPKSPPPPSAPGGSRSAAIRLVAAAGDPLVGLAADIDYEGTITVTVTRITVDVNFHGKIDDFPSYDCYAELDGKTKSLFMISPPPGNTVANLMGAANRPVTGRVSFP